MKVVTKKFKLSAAFEKHVRSKLASIEKKFSLNDVTITVSKEKTSSTVQLLGIAPRAPHAQGGTVKIKCSAPDAYVAVDKLRSVCKDKLSRMKEKKSGKRRTAAPVPPVRKDKIRKVRVSVMSRQEATDKMLGRNYNFWLFVDRDTGVFTALYRKEDGQVSVAHPVFDE
ncbi:MAG: HPF/RaiA family ribosome-associated protein [Elusimicrobiota bacterium]|nr:HPF/RaiA family ribosome-associated protein [Elusimicrobiota bacterium]